MENINCLSKEPPQGLINALQFFSCKELLRDFHQGAAEEQVSLAPPAGSSVALKSGAVPSRSYRCPPRPALVTESEGPALFAQDLTPRTHSADAECTDVSKHNPPRLKVLSSVCSASKRTWGARHPGSSLIRTGVPGRLIFAHQRESLIKLHFTLLYPGEGLRH